MTNKKSIGALVQAFAQSMHVCGIQRNTTPFLIGIYHSLSVEDLKECIKAGISSILINATDSPLLFTTLPAYIKQVFSVIFSIRFTPFMIFMISSINKSIREKISSNNQGSQVHGETGTIKNYAEPVKRLNPRPPINREPQNGCQRHNCSY